MKLGCVVVIATLMFVAIAANPQEPESQASKERPTRTRVVLLGTGTPVPDPDRSAPATVIAVDDGAYLVDFGPGGSDTASGGSSQDMKPVMIPISKRWQ